MFTRRRGAVYVSGSTGQVCVGRPTAPNTAPSSYTCTQVAETNENAANIFFVVRVADDGRKWLNPGTNVQEEVGTAYVVYSNGFKVFLRHSIDGGRTWSDRVRVSDGLNTRTALFPWLETGPTPGSVGVVWYGTSAAVNNDDANWQVFYAQSFNADEAVPTFRQVTASDHLRGQTFTNGANAKTDITRGGTLFTIERCSGGTGGGGGGSVNHGQAFRVTGNGKIFGKTVSFEINVDDLPSGRVKYHDKEQRIEFASDRITGFTRLATNKVSFTGEATINGQQVLFAIEVEDNGEPGTSDRFRIVITGAVNSTREGALTQGNIQFHR